MRDREFAVAHKALIESTPDKTTIPESFNLIGKSVLYGKKGRVHTVVIPVKVPKTNFDYARLRVIGDEKVLTEKHVEVHSWFRNFYNWNVSMMCGIEADDNTWGDGKISGKDTGANVRFANRPFGQYNAGLEVSGNRAIPNYGYVAAEEVDDYGIVVGTDDTAASWEDDVALGSQVANGTGSGQFEYAMSEIPAIYSFDSGTLTRSHYRYFDNFNTDENTITIEEVGLIGSLYLGAKYYFLVARDVLDEAVDVPFRAILEVMYEYSLDYPGSGSPLRNFFNFTFSQFASLNGNDPDFEDGDVNVKDTTGTLYFPATPQVIGFNAVNVLDSPNYGYCGFNNNIAFGACIGSGSTAVTFNDYYLDTIIPDATMNYPSGVAPALSWADPVMTVSHLRNFTNVSGGNVDVNESGLIARLRQSASYYNVMMFRDVFSTVTIANGDVLALTYQLSVDYPS